MFDAKITSKEVSAINGLRLYKKPHGDKFWKNNQGQLHKTDAPAVELSDGSKFWYIYGIELTEEEFDNWVKNNGTDWNDELETLFKLTHC